jgi:ABC-type antimicrobial peptide transport system permease subunit
LGKHLVYDEKDMTVVGVIKNVHTRSLHEEIRPLLVGNGIRNLFTVNIKLNKGANLASAVDAIQNAVKSIYSVERPEIKFLDETVEGFYQSEVRLRKILFFATIMAILISALGLFGLASFTISQRTKEISIRKVLGASVAELIVLISKEYAILIGIAFLLAAYPAWYFIKDWLNGFQYKIEVPYGVFILAGIIALILCMTIVSFHSLRAASSNPAKILKDE